MQLQRKVPGKLMGPDSLSLASPPSGLAHPPHVMMGLPAERKLALTSVTANLLTSGSMASLGFAPDKDALSAAPSAAGSSNVAPERSVAVLDMAAGSCRSSGP